MNRSTMTPTVEGRPGPSTDQTRVPQVHVGDTVLVLVDAGVRRPLVVAEVHPDGTVSGMIVCTHDDHLRPAFRGWSSQLDADAQILGHPDRLLPLASGVHLRAGVGLGQWITRPSLLSSGGR